MNEPTTTTDGRKGFYAQGDCIFVETVRELQAEIAARDEALRLAAANGLLCRDTGGSGGTYSYYTSGTLEIQVPMGTEREKFKMNYFLCAAIELKLLDALTFHYDTIYERDWVEDFLKKYWPLDYPRMVATEA